jgi:4-amino-4-deoxy-L-arabinose transferase-like glycosyltransferase
MADSRARAPGRPALGPLLLLAVAAVALATAWWRPIDGDEGYYAAAARLVGEGRVPYTDFFYPQAPLVPVVYAPVVQVAGPNLHALRIFSALLLTATAALWWRHLRGRYRGATWPAAIGAAWLVLQPDALSWSVTVKTYALTGLLTTVAWVMLWHGLAGRRRRPALVAAGLALGLAGAARLLFAPLGPVVAVALALTGWRAGERRATWLGTAALVAGGWLAGSLPAIIFWLRDPAAFVFDNLRYHEIRFSELRTAHPDAGPLRRIAASLAGFGGILLRNPFLVIQFVLLAVGAAELRRAEGPARRFLGVVATAVLVYVVSCLAPDPVYAQYFGAPLASLGLPLTVAALLALGGAGSRRRGTLAALLVVLGAGVFFGGRPGMDGAPTWSFATYREVVAEIRAQSEPDDVVFSLWPGYVFESGRRFLPGFENHFAIGVSAGLDGAERTRFRIPNHRSLTAAFAARTPRVAVFGTWRHEIDLALDDAQMSRLLTTVRENYDLVREFGRTSVWTARPSGPDN